MSSTSANRRDERLGLILEQVRSVRLRKNSLAWQTGIFSSLALIVAGGAMTLVAAYHMRPLPFLILAALLAAAVIAGTYGAIKNAWRMWLNPERAAILADASAGLKGRIATVVAMSRARKRSSLWPYLVADTLNFSESFEASQIEPRLLSRSFYGFLAACLLAALAVPLAMAHPSHPRHSASSQGEITMDMQDLHVRPADPDDSADMELSADPNTMQRLQQRLAAEGEGRSSADSGAISHMMKRAQRLAGKLQDKLTGNSSDPERLRLRLAQIPGEDSSGHNPRNAPAGGQNGRDRDLSEFQFQRKTEYGPGGVHMDPDAPAQEQATKQPANPDDTGQLAQNGSNKGGESAEQLNGEQSSSGSSGTSSHGIGGDPEHLFGSPETPGLGGEGFAISIDARQADQGKDRSGQAYVPPHVRVPLNSAQAPDEPMARASIPAVDRAAVERVFER